MLSDGPLTLLPGPTLEAPIRLTTPTANLRLTAQGTAPVRQLSQPTAIVELFAEDRPSTIPIRADFILERSQGGLNAYNRALGTAVPPGNYRVRVRVTDMDGLPVNLELLEFTP